MKLLNLFTREHINDVLKNTFSYGDKSEFLFSVEKCNCNENLTFLNVNDDGIKQEYILVKVTERLKTEGQQPLQSSNVLYPVFYLEDGNKQIYGAFETHQQDIEHFTLPKENDVECLQVILENLAEHQALELANGKEYEREKGSENNVKDFIDVVLTLDFFKDLDKSIIEEAIKNIQLNLSNIFDTPNLLVKRIGCPLAKNVCVNQRINRSIFFNTSSQKSMPPVYDALLYIFGLTDDKFRQEHFETLVIYYFNSLKKYLQQLKSDIADKIKREYIEQQVRVLLPVVKFEIIKFLALSVKSPKLQEILTNIRFFLKYPLLNQEDIYEVVKNKLECVHYDLLDYNLKSLTETNGHLGEYFHLDIKIKVKGKQVDLQLFAKFIKVTTELMKEIVESGPAKKEDFFYRELIPLFQKYKLDRILDFAPKCYLSRISWLLVLDDLSREGYIGLKPNVVLDYDGLKVNLKNLAKFHACSIILEEILSHDFGKIVRLDEDYGEYFEETLMIYEEGNYLKPLYDDVLELYYYIFDKFPEITDKLNRSCDELRAGIKKVFLSLFSKVKKSDAIRNVINHGDMYVANMLFKLGEDKLITNGMLIDFQILRYVSPTYELLFYLFVNSTRETRNKYLNSLIEDYYRYLEENFKQFNIDPEVVLPRRTFNENIKFMKSAAIIASLNYVHVTHIDPDFREEIFHDQEKFDYYLQKHKQELVDLSWESEHYRNIIKGLVEDIVDIIRDDL